MCKQKRLHQTICLGMVGGRTLLPNTHNLVHVPQSMQITNLDLGQTQDIRVCHAYKSQVASCWNSIALVRSS